MPRDSRPPDHKLVVKSVKHTPQGAIILNIGQMALWVNREKKEISGVLILNQNPDVEYIVLTDDRSKGDKST